MIFKLTARNCHISTTTQKYINQHTKKLIQLLPNTEEDLIVFRMIIKKNIDKYHPPRASPHLHKRYADVKPALAYFEGSATFRLGKKQLYVHFKGQTIVECVDKGFGHIFRELGNYKQASRLRDKDLHFPGESEYPDRRSVRRSISYE